jgi:cyclase
MFVERVSEWTYANLTGASRCNMGAITLPDYTIIVDPGKYPQFSMKFRKIIEKKIGTPVKKVFLTHGHSDHVFGSQIFRDCEIIANQAIMAQIQESAKSEWTRAGLEMAARIRPDSYKPLDLDSLEIILPTKVVDSEFTLSEDGFEILYKQVGGHSIDSSYIYFVTERVMFVGDLLLTREFPWGGAPTSDLDSWIQAFKEFQHLGVEKLVPGHGALCVPEKIQTYLDFFEPVAKIMKEMITEGRSQAEIVNYDGYPDFFPPRMPEWYTSSLTQWYRTFKKKLQ